ncbi:Lrp/AsnC ligand binding domain-containing protein [Bifidobacterium sp.]|jgi:DNA-binding Lrp family transcriptional regulator|uniref:Lrp/AsnC ligand binding domain-containing protein n=1 Tax=Bifidobacterium sp. TaxID=41200 RepID=UPI0025C30883|nr:Lrp/AsnC ligand binding domain-containing protein [Bifidobacterium sp.]MCH4208950.1 Lrp/AsnC ligand binding domain-containing protein [Bifidobacterium sp.]MCI1225520.1 Lrp/AsnC ligand binding domain-containing protein [Bifidobacterium sp.]
MADAVVLITTESDKVSEAAQAIVEIPGVKDVYSVAGEVDLVAIVSTADFDDLTGIIPGGIAKVDGVVGTQTLMAFRQYSRQDEAAAFDLGVD